MIAEVILESYSLPREAFSYAIPDIIPCRDAPPWRGVSTDVRVGMLVEVPFRNKLEKAIVVGLKEAEESANLKEIRRVLNPTPILAVWQIELAYWIAEYYRCPLFKTIDLFVPKLAWEEKQEDWVNREIHVTLLDASLARGTKEKRIAEWLIFHREKTFQDMSRELEVSKPYLRKLAEKGILSLREGDIVPPYFKEYDLGSIAVIDEKGLKKLTVAQEKAYQAILDNGQKVFLLHGITGSGKTEIYLHLAYNDYRHGRQTLILVPEIALTPQLIGYFFKVFGKSISVIHSQLSDGERFTEWVRIKNRESSVVIGSRSALFSPFQDLGTIVIDEEHEWSYKSDQNPRYHTRSVVVEMNRKLGTAVILGSATPDIESYYRATEGQYILLELSNKIVV